MRYSFTEITTFQRCPRRYQLSRTWEKAVDDWRPSLGTWVHELLATHFRHHDSDLFDQRQAVRDTQDRLHDLFDENVRPFTSDDDLLAVPHRAWEMYLMWEADQATLFESWEVLHVEESFDVEIEPGYWVGVTPDLVIRSLTTGEIWIVDHKTTSTIPHEFDALDDPQFRLYVAALRRVYPSDTVKGMLFNYIRSKSPTTPSLTKDGKRIANLNRIDTTAVFLEQFAISHRMDKDPDVVARVAELRADRTKWAAIVPVWLDEAAYGVAETDAINVMEQINDMDAWCDTAFPRTVLPPSAGSRSCRACPYAPICSAELAGEDASTIIESEYVEREPLDRIYTEVPYDNETNPASE